MIDGVSLFTFCEFTELNAFIITAGVGQAFMVIGGVQLLTGVSMSYFTIGAIFAGTGELTVFGGAQIATGVSVFDAYALNAAYGAGLDYCVGGGVLVRAMCEHAGGRTAHHACIFMSVELRGIPFPHLHCTQPSRSTSAPPSTSTAAPKTRCAVLRACGAAFACTGCRL